MPEQRLPRLLRDRTAHEAGGDRCQREARTSKRALHVTSKELWVARAHFPSPCPKHEIFVQGGVRIPCMWAHGCDLHHQANARVPRARISYIASPVSRHRVTLPNPLPDDSWAVDERSLKLFVDQLQEPPADRAWWASGRGSSRRSSSSASRPRPIRTTGRASPKRSSPTTGRARAGTPRRSCDIAGTW